MPVETTKNYIRVRVRIPRVFSKFRVITHRSHLHPKDQARVRAILRRHGKSSRARCKYVVGKLKKKYKKVYGNPARKGGKRAWALQSVLIPKKKYWRRK